MDKVAECEGSRIDALEVKIFLLKFRTGVGCTAADIAGFGSEEKVGDELCTVDL
jgi:hypothetical protein